MSDAVQYGRWIAGVALLAGYALLAHHTNTSSHNQTLGVVLALAPIALGLATLAWHARHRMLMLGLLALGAVALLLLRPTLERHFHWIYWIEHAGTQATLCLAFAATLRAGQEPMCARFARMVHGSLPPALARYTRQITIGWSVFFGLMALTSSALFLLAPLATWSIFVNFLTGPLICTMFVLEYGARHWLLPEMEQVNILAVVKAMRKSPSIQAQD